MTRSLEFGAENDPSHTPLANCERIFAGWHKPLLPRAAEILKERYAQDAVWDMSSVLLVLPGARAGRRLRQIMESMAAGKV